MHRFKVSVLMLGLTLMAAPLIMGNGCAPTTDSGGALPVNRTVTVTAGGGGTLVSFNGTAGQTIRVTLTGTPATMEPYGYLESPDGTAEYTPANGAASGGVNSSTVALTRSGEYTLTVFDASNLGGSVAVRIEVVSG